MQAARRPRQTVVPARGVAHQARRQGVPRLERPEEAAAVRRLQGLARAGAVPTRPAGQIRGAGGRHPHGRPGVVRGARAPGRADAGHRVGHHLRRAAARSRGARADLQGDMLQHSRCSRRVAVVLRPPARAHVAGVPRGRGRVRHWGPHEVAAGRGGREALPILGVPRLAEVLVLGRAGRHHFGPRAPPDEGCEVHRDRVELERDCLRRHRVRGEGGATGEAVVPGRGAGPPLRRRRLPHARG
mmetsp:Transcript_47485/g.144541  ORF Transcript_47485/g.144541 Transcript_47485/m.144541 type:complete len:243 (+) Transcript_47485:310-1038(+)